MAFHQNWIGFLELMPAYLETARCWRQDGMFMGATGIRMSAFNAAILEGRADLTAQDLNRIEDTFTAMNLPYSIQLRSSSPHPDCAAMLVENGFVELFCDPLMQCHGQLTLPRLNPDVLLTTVENFEDKLIYTDIVTQGFDVLAGTMQEFLDILLEMREAYHVIAWLHDRPVGAGTIILAGGVAGVYNMATVPSARRRGVAVVIMDALHRYALDQGYNGTALASTPMGLKLYDTLGYVHEGYQMAFVPTGELQIDYA